MARKIAIVGVGKIALDQHVPAIAASPDWELAATVSRHNGVPGVQSFSAIEDMLAARPDIEVVSLCLPPVPRFHAALSALRAGRHVILEKPPGATLSECLALEAEAQRRNVSLFATWHSREADGVEGARAWLKDKQVRRLTVTWKEDVRRWHPGQTWIFEPGGLGVFDPGINALSIVTAILADPVHVTEALLEVPANCQTPIAATLSFHHPHGADVSAHFDFRQQGDQIWTIEVETDDGTLRLDKGGARLSIDGKEVIADVDLTLSGEYPRLYANISRLIEGGYSDVDLAPMRHVADAFTLGMRVIVDPFVL